MVAPSHLSNGRSSDSASRPSTSQAGIFNANISPSSVPTSGTEYEPPTDEQGFFFRPCGSYLLENYLMKIKDVVGGAENIIASRMEKNRVTVYLKKADLLENIVKSEAGFEIDGIPFKCRKLTEPVHPVEKIMFSKVSPAIPNDVVEKNAVKILKLEIMSRVSVRKNDFVNQELFGHIVGEQRQVDVFMDLETPLPEYFDFTYNNEPHRIFVTRESAIKDCNGQNGSVNDTNSVNKTTATVENEPQPSTSGRRGVREGRRIPGNQTEESSGLQQLQETILRAIIRKIRKKKDCKSKIETDVFLEIYYKIRKGTTSVEKVRDILNVREIPANWYLEMVKEIYDYEDHDGVIGLKGGNKASFHRLLTKLKKVVGAVNVETGNRPAQP